MPRSVRDSDDDVETRTGRKTRAGAGSAIPESPVRRSSRNKQSTKKDDSSPDLSVTETSNTQTTRSYRTRAGTVDSNSLEVQRRLRSNRNTVDMNETKDLEVSTEAQPKKMTRRSIAAINATETPKANTRTRRLTRAGSETKSTPTGRVTRKTRASSMDPESTMEQPVKEKYESHIIDTPSRAKRRASILPSESTVIEEEEKQIPFIDLEKTLIEEDELPTNVSPKNAETSDKILEPMENKSNEEYENIDKAAEEKDCSAVKGPVDHSSENDHMEINENLINEEPMHETQPLTPGQSNVLGNDKDCTNDMEVTLTRDVIHNTSTDSSHSVEYILKEIESKDENILHVSLEEGEINTSDKENENLNISNSISKQNKNESILNVSVEEGEINTSNKENECLNIDGSMSKQNKNISNIKKLNQEVSITTLDTSIKEDSAQCNDNTKLGKSCLMECSVSILNCDNLIQNLNATNEIQMTDLDTKETTCHEEQDHNNIKISTDKGNMDSITLMETSDILNTVSNKILNEEDTIAKEQSILHDYSNNDIQDKIIREEGKNLETVSQNTNNTEEINCSEENKSEVNVSVISNNALNVSVNPKENLIDTSIKVDNCTENAEITEVSNANKDINESTVSKDSHTKQDNIPSTNERQDSMSTSEYNSSTVILQVDDGSIEEPASNTEQTKLHSSECLIDLQSPKPSNSILETNDSSTVAESRDGPEEDFLDDEGSKIKSSSDTPKVSKRKSVTELNTSKIEEEAEKDDAQNVDEGDNMRNVGTLFQDISADEWKEKHPNLNAESENNSVHSTSTVKLENDSETECDLILVDKEAWLAAENLKTIKDKETFDYDSDDTVVLKSKMDYLNDSINKSNRMQSSCKDSTQDNDNINSSKLSSTEIKGKLNEKANIDECDVNVSLQNTSTKEKSQYKTKEDIGNISKNDFGKSPDKQLEEEEELALSQKESEDQNKSENKLAKSTLDRKEEKNRSLNSSLNKKNKLKQGSNKYNRLHISSSEEEDEANNSEDNKNKIKSSEKNRNNRNYSTRVHIGSDSDSSDDSIDSSKSDKRNESLRIPRFLFKHKGSEDENEDSRESDDESNGDRSSNESIDSDINAEYNLDGKTIGKFSDDDIPGDECRASESESSDPDDNGSDLADFVVDDDEVEEEEEDEDEDEEEEQEEDEEVDQEMKDAEVTDDKNEKKGVKSKDILSSEEKKKETSNKSLNASNIKSDKKKNQKQKTSSEIHSSESAEDEIVSDNKFNTSITLDSTHSERKKKKNQILNENSEIVEEIPKRDLNESEVKFIRKTKSTGASLACSTPKTDVHQHEQFKHNISSEKKKRKYIEKTSVSYESEKIRLKDLSANNSDNNKTTLNNSVNTKKRHSVENNISADLLKLVKETNLPRPLLSKKAHLNKTLSPSSETPNTKYLKKQKLNDSAPLIKLKESKRASGNISLTDKKKGNPEKDETSAVINEKTIEMLELDSSLSAKRKRSIEATKLGDQTELKHQNSISNTKQSSEVYDKAELHIASDNEKASSECTLKIDDGKKKKNKKKNFKELGIVDIEAKMVGENDGKIKVKSNTESKKNKNKNKNEKNIENEDKNNDKPSNVIKNYKKCLEVENIPNKPKKKVTSEIASLQVREQSKKSLRKDVSKDLLSSNIELSNDMPESIEFLKSKYEALEAAKRAAESIQANKYMRKKKRTEYFEKMQQEKEMEKPKIEPTVMSTTRGIKRLSIDVIENLSDIPTRPLKKQKLSRKSTQETSYIVTKNGFTESSISKVNKNWIPSNCGGTTEFDVVNLQKARKQLKKIPAVASFRQKMLSRNSRYPITSYIMYLQKQKASRGDQGFVKKV